MDATVPLWAFVSLALTSPILALLGVIISDQAQTKRDHRHWLRQTKYESYERLFVAYAELKEAHSDLLGSEPVMTSEVLERLSRAELNFREHNERTQLVASIRASLAVERDMMSTWSLIYGQLQDATPRTSPSRPTQGMGRPRQCPSSRSNRPG